MKIIVSRQELQAALLFASTDETRYVITGVNVEVKSGAKPLLVATDGRRLVAIETVAEQAAEELFDHEHALLLRPDFVKPIVALSKAFGGKLYPWICFESDPGSKRVHVSLVGGHVFLEAEQDALIEGEFPNWRAAVPAKNRKREPITDIGLNAEYVGDFAKAAKALGAESPLIQMNLVGKEAQVEVKLMGLPNFYGLVMQCGLQNGVEYQPEFLKIVEQFAEETPDAEPEPEPDPQEA